MLDDCIRIYPCLGRLAMRLTPDMTLCQDVAQEMALSICKAPPGNTNAWYVRHAELRARDWLRRERRQLSLVIPVGRLPKNAADGRNT
mgnify:CR=1 FL=1